MAEPVGATSGTSLPPTLAAPYRWVFDGVLARVAGVIQFGTAGRGLPILFLLVVLALGLGTWLTPPINGDIKGFALPLSGARMSVENATDLLYGRVDAPPPPENPGLVTRARVALIGGRPISIFSVGTLVLGAFLAGLGLLIWRARWTSHAFGLMTAALIAGWFVAAMNHPVLVDELDRQATYRSYLVAVLEATVNPALPLTVATRVGETALTSTRGSLLRGTKYVPQSREVVILLALLGLILTARGSLWRRAALAAPWLGAGLALGGLLTMPRCLADWNWHGAQLADAQGDTDRADRLAQSALARFPALAEIGLTWAFVGKLDYRRGRDTAAARYFLVEQRAHWGDQLGMLEGLAQLSATDQPAPAIFRWYAERTAGYAMKLFEQQKLGPARRYWNLARDTDPRQRYLPLLDTLLTAVDERSAPDAIRDQIQPLLRDMPDNTLRCSLQSALGDLYFECGRFAEARDWYERSLRSYALPKQINYRAMRGLLGM